jgi:ubiquinone/menaquinone biosynthesis C-methylase UbiE
MAADEKKAYRGLGMEGITAKWYACLTRKDAMEFEALARRVKDEAGPQARVLEVAPGPGYFAIELAKIGQYQITGIDISSTFVEIARRNASKAGVEIDFRHGNAAALPFADGSFDFIFCRAAFKNFADPVGSLEEMYRVLDKGGQALIIDLRKDATKESIRRSVEQMDLGTLNRFLTKFIFRFMLLKRAYSKSDFEQFVARTKFPLVDIFEGRIGLELSLQR